MSSGYYFSKASYDIVVVYPKAYEWYSTYWRVWCTCPRTKLTDYTMKINCEYLGPL